MMYPKPLHHRSVAVTAVFACLLVSVPASAQDPGAFAAHASACVSSNQAKVCLPGYLAEQLYFPQARELAKHSEECASAVTAARKRDGHGWYLSGEEFTDCVLSAEAPFPGSGVAPQEALQQCLSGRSLFLNKEAGFARLEGEEFMCELEHKADGWAITQLLQKP